MTASVVPVGAEVNNRKKYDSSRSWTSSQDTVLETPNVHEHNNLFQCPLNEMPMPINVPSVYDDMRNRYLAIEKCKMDFRCYQPECYMKDLKPPTLTRSVARKLYTTCAPLQCVTCGKTELVTITY